MINNRGKIIALGGGGLFLIMIVVQNMGGGSKSKDSFYETFSSTEAVDVSDSKKKTASLKIDEEEIMESSESYQQSIKHNSKDKAFSLYRELLTEDDEEVVETIVNADSVAQQTEEVIEEVKEKKVVERIVYVQAPVTTQQQTTTVQQEPEKKKLQRLTSRRSRNSSNTSGDNNAQNSAANNTGGKYIKAEIYRAVSVDLKYPQGITIRVLDDNSTTLPSGQVIKNNMILKGTPSKSGNSLLITVPEYNLAVYDEIAMKGIPLTASEGISEQADNLKKTEVSGNVNVPFVGSVELSTGRKRENSKVNLNASRTIYLKWID